MDSSIEAIASVEAKKVNLAKHVLFGPAIFSGGKTFQTVKDTCLSGFKVSIPLKTQRPSRSANFGLRSRTATASAECDELDNVQGTISLI